MVKISIFDIVVGDVVPLRIGDQVSLFQYCSLLLLLTSLQLTNYIMGV